MTNDHAEDSAGLRAQSQTQPDLPAASHRATVAGLQGRVTPCTEDYLRVLGVGAIRGRALSFSDVSAGRRVAVVNQALVRQLFGEEDPLGASIRITGVPSAPNNLKDATFEIWGDTRHR